MKCETSLSNGRKKISETNRPGMVIIHKSTCGACNSLKPKLLASKEINRLSDSFVVISLMDDAVPRESTFFPDGKYVPRIFFLDTSGQVMKEVMNLNGNPKYKYYYSNEQSLIKSMQRKRMKCDFKLHQGLSRMRASQQPGMIVIYKSWCPVCTELKARLSASREIDQLSNYIVMVVLKDEDEPEDRAFAPDGGYIPRIFFTNPDGRILYDVFNNKGDPRIKNLSVFNKYFGTNLKWETNLETGLQKIVTRQKPGMIIFHKSWCGACRSLKPKFQASKDIEDLSGGFVLISLADDNHPKDAKYMPDGDYVPRILFLSPQGALLVDVINAEGSSDYKYFYSDAESIARSMKTVLNKYLGG